MSKLAILGGTPVLNEPLPLYSSVGQEELDAVTEVIKSGQLSGFYGSWGNEFFGGPVVKEFEKAWAERFTASHVVSVNSATSGLCAAMGAISISPGDEVIMPSYTMSATAMAPLMYGGVPVFVDIEPDTFCIDPHLVRQAITPRTKAIVAVNLLGHPAQLDKLLAIAKEFELWLIEDNSQSPLATENGRYCGTIGHIGVFSLNYHKHLHTGEGGMCVTNDDRLAERLQVIRNHGENIVEPAHIDDIVNLVGFNFRMTELSAAVGIQQLKRIDEHVDRSGHVALQLSEGIKDLEGLTPPTVRGDCRHVYYAWAARFDEDTVGIDRQRFSMALAAEGFPNFVGGVRPLYLLPVFQKRIAFGPLGYPFNLSPVQYRKGQCPVHERIYEKELIGYEPCKYATGSQQVELLLEAVHKVYANRASLHEVEATVTLS